MKSLEQRIAALEKDVAELKKELASKLSKQYDEEEMNEMQSKGGKARAEKLSKERRIEIASKAAKALWAKRKQK